MSKITSSSAGYQTFPTVTNYEEDCRNDDKAISPFPAFLQIFSEVRIFIYICSSHPFSVKADSEVTVLIFLY